MSAKLLIFDLDGTILNTLDDLANSVNYALQMKKLPQRTIDEIRQFVGNGIQKLVERAVPDGTEYALCIEVFETFKRHYQVHCADLTKPYEGVIELLQKLRKQGFLIAVVSNKADVAVQELCNHYFPETFDYVAGEKEGIRRKPCPDSVYAILEKYQIKKEDAIYIGDSEVDIETAKNAGIKEIAVAWGFRDIAFLKKMGASCIVETPDEIWKMIQ